MTSTFFDALDLVRTAVYSDTPIESRWSTIKPFLDDPDVAREFWKMLPDASWLPILRDAGMFVSPPNTEVDAAGSHVRYIPWPQSQYLARISEGSTTAVASAVAQIVESLRTDNASINSDILEIALAIPTDIATRLVKTVSAAARSQGIWFGTDKASAFCARLASEGHVDGALELASSLFSIEPTSGKRMRSLEERAYWYMNGLQLIAPPFIANEPVEFCSRLAMWLSLAVKKEDAKNEYSYIWRPAIEDHEDNTSGEFLSDFVTLVRNAFEKSITEHGLTLRAALDILSRYESQILARLRLHLIRVFEKDEPGLARATMLSRTLFDNNSLKHEYAYLVADHWVRLNPTQQAEWLGWVKSTVTEIAAGTKWGKSDAEEVRKERANIWEYERLHWIESNLTGERRQRYDDLSSQYGEPRFSDGNVRASFGRWGAESPFALEDLKRRSFDDVVSLVNSWVPSEPYSLGPDREGLAITFGQYVADNAVELSRQALKLRESTPIFVRTYLSKIDDAIRRNLEVDVGAVLDLSAWVIGQPMSTKVDDMVDIEDQDWRWTREVITPLLESICSATDGENARYSPNEYRQRVWEILEHAVVSSTASIIVRERSEEDPRVHDYLIMAINSPRGKAVSSALEYARWVRRHYERVVSTVEGKRKGLELMPEVRKMLDWQVDPVNQSVEASAILGSRIGLLYWLDKDWLIKNVPSLFSIEPYSSGRSKECGWAAWNSFLVWVQPHVAYYEILEPQYSYAARQSEAVSLKTDDQKQPMFRLSEHLFLLYGRGHLAFDGSEGGFLRLFILKTNTKVREHAFKSIGWSLRREKSIPEPIIRRFMELWDFYWQHGSGKDESRDSDVDLFGQWFASGHFPHEWAMQRLLWILEVNPRVQYDEDVLKYLASIAPSDVAKSVSILNAVAHGDIEGWRINLWREAAKSILRLGVERGGGPKEEAEALIDFLGRRGLLDFGELLNH